GTTIGYGGDGGPAVAAQIRQSTDVKVAPDGSIWIADLNSNRVRRVSPPLPGFTNTDIALPSGDGGQLYQFDAPGRHLRTLNTLTGATRYHFSYDSSGRLTSVTDGDGNVTTIQRDPTTGNPTGILGQFGQLMPVQLDVNGFLSRVSDPAGHVYVFTSSA